jgi:acyl-CoA thioesterase
MNIEDRAVPIDAAIATWTEQTLASHEIFGSEMTPFSALIAGMQLGVESHSLSHSHSIDLPPDWLQGRTAYGGLSAALCLEATHRSIENLPPLRSAQYCFVGPATGNLNISAKILRKGKSTTLVGCDMTGESGLAIRSTLCFGASRPSAHNYQSLVAPQVAGPNDCSSYFNWNASPSFAQHFDGRLASGAMPRTDGAKPAMTVWLRHQDVGDETSMVRLLALADALPPAALVLSKEPIPLSTLTWSIDVLDPYSFTSTGWWLAQATCDTSREGYSAQETIIWSPDGKPVLIARQNVAIFG